MRIVGLYPIDSKIPNLPLMKISAWHKSIGDRTMLYRKYTKFDIIYISKIFSKSSTRSIPLNFKCKKIFGGSGYSITNKLPHKIEHIYPDYSLYKIDYAMGFLTRGCINNCPFCIVPKKEGRLHRHASITEFWNEQKKVMLLDNALSDFEPAWSDLEITRDNGVKVDICQGFNVRTVKPRFAKLLSELKRWNNKQWKIAWDNINDEEKIIRGIEILNKSGIKNYMIMCYVLVGFNSSIKQDLYRIEKLDKLGIDPFVMIYNKNKLLSHLARWCNRPQIRHSCSFLEYIKGDNNIK